MAEAPASYGDTDDKLLELALQIDKSVKNKRPDSWRGVHAREQIIRGAIYTALQGQSVNADADMVEKIFRIIMQQKEY